MGYFAGSSRQGTRYDGVSQKWSHQFGSQVHVPVSWRSVRVFLPASLHMVAGGVLLVSASPVASVLTPSPALLIGLSLCVRNPGSQEIRCLAQPRGVVCSWSNHLCVSGTWALRGGSDWPLLHPEPWSLPLSCPFWPITMTTEAMFPTPGRRGLYRPAPRPPCLTE